MILKFYIIAHSCSISFACLSTPFLVSVSFSTAGFCCLERHFALVNIQDGYLLAYMSGNERYLVLDMDHLQGLDYLWAVALDARDVHVSRAAMEVSGMEGVCRSLLLILLILYSFIIIFYILFFFLNLYLYFLI